MLVDIGSVGWAVPSMSYTHTHIHGLRIGLTTDWPAVNNVGK